MGSIQVHPFSVALGALTVATAGLLAGWSKGPPGPLDFMSVVQIDDGFGNMIDTVRFTGCNVQVVNGLDDAETINGAGNLIVGYNEPPLPGGPSPEPDRTGSHNIVGGNENNYGSYGGLVVGSTNTISGVYASVSGGEHNMASGIKSSVSGGRCNKASGGSSSGIGKGAGELTLREVRSSPPASTIPKITAPKTRSAVRTPRCARLFIPFLR